MIYLELLIGFLKVGLFSFGGAYAAIPLIREVVLSYGWVTEEMLTDMIAVSESTPGPIMVNLATYVGSTKAGIPGAILAVLAVVLPSFLIMLLAAAVLKSILRNQAVEAVLGGLIPCVAGIILATGCYMLFSGTVLPAFSGETDLRPLLIAAVLSLLYFGSRKVMKKGLSPILLILISACAGVTLYGF